MRKKRNRGSKLDPYREKIRALKDEHNLSGVRILKENRKSGYNAGYTILKDYCLNLERIAGYRLSIDMRQDQESSPK